MYIGNRSFIHIYIVCIVCIVIVFTNIHHIHSAHKLDRIKDDNRKYESKS